MKCPACSNQVDGKNINIQTDLAQCGNCNNIFKVSEALNDIGPIEFELSEPPKGAWIRNDMRNTIIGATTQSPVAFFMVPFMLVWSGGALGGVYGTQIISGEFDLVMSLFGIPFLIGAIIFWSLTFMTIWGKVELTIDKHGGKVFTGVGSIGKTKEFTWDEISSVRESLSRYKYPGSHGSSILLEGKRRISFGLGVNEARRYYLLRALKFIVANAKSNKNLV